MIILLFFLLFFGLILVGGIVGYFVHMLFFEKDNPDSAFVFVCNGTHVSKPFKAKLVDSDKVGKSFIYNNKQVTILPNQYKKETYFKHRRMIFISKQGQIISSPFDENVKLSDSEREDIIFQLSTGHLGADMLRFMNGKATIPTWLIVALIILILVVLGGGVFYFTQQPAKPVQQQTQSQQQTTNNNTITLPPSGELK